MTPPQIDLFVGSLIDVHSERIVIEHLHALALTGGADVVLLANFSLGGRQIDVLVATAQGALLVEAKGARNPITGKVNGAWSMATAAGPKPYRNAYLQALDAKNRLRDAMAASGPGAPYCDAAVVFVPAVPPGSTLPAGDHKVGVLSVADLSLPAAQRDAWPLEHWRAFATDQGLDQVATLPALFDPALRDAEVLLDTYLSGFQVTYGSRAAQLQPFSCVDPDGQPCGSQAVPALLESRDGLLILGPSGCGKSLLGAALAQAVILAGGLSIVIDAKLFVDKLADVLDHEVALVVGARAKTLIGAAARMARAMVLIVDGFNECPEPDRRALTRAVRALALRTGAKVVVTSQIAPDSTLLDLPTVQVPVPSLALKRSIASAIGPLPAHADQLLDAVQTGLEARILGEVGHRLVPASSRYALFDLFVRTRLGDQGGRGIRLLAAIASELTRRRSFSLSIRDFDRLDPQVLPDPAILQDLLRAGLLDQRGDRLSFGHELILHAFQAEALVRECQGDAEALSAALRQPVLYEARRFVIGAIDQPDLLAAFLSTLSDPLLIASCAAGECGLQARAWADQMLETTLSAVASEARGARFVLQEDGFLGVALDPSVSRAWTPTERAFIEVLPQWAFSPGRLPMALEMVGAIDETLADELRRLSPAAAEAKTALRSGLFANTYVHGALALQQALAPSALKWLGSAEDLADAFNNAALADGCSPGQVALLLQLSRGVPGISRLTAAALATAITRDWARAPYHLRLDLLEAAGFCWAADEVDQAAMRDVLEALPTPGHPFLSTALIEALQQLGALDEASAEYAVGLKARILEVLERPDDPDAQEEAWSFYGCRFDHPYEAAYSEVYEDLNEAGRTRLLSMAAWVADLNAFFTGPLLIDLASRRDPVAGRPILRWIDLPTEKVMMPQEALRNFIICHIALAVLGIAPADRPAAPASIPQACADLFAMVYAPGAEPDLQRARISACWDQLDVDPGAAIGFLDACIGLNIEGLKRLVGRPYSPIELFETAPSRSLKLCRAVLADPCAVRPWYASSMFEHERPLDYAMKIVGMWGDITDLQALRALAEQPRFAPTALKQIQVLEERLLSGWG